MIVVVGNPAWRAADPAGPAGRACGVAVAAASRSARVELVGRAGDDPNGDALLIALARAGVGHVAVLRDPARPTPVVAPAPLPDDDVEALLLAEPDPASRSSDDARAPRLEPADVSLGLQYLTAFGVLVVTDDAPGVVPVAAEAASFAGAHLVVLVRPGDSPPESVPASSTVLVTPEDDTDGDFATLVGYYAAALDAGVDPADAFREALGAGWEPETA